MKPQYSFLTILETTNAGFMLTNLNLGWVTARWTAQYIEYSWCFQVSIFFPSPILSSRRLSQLNRFFSMFLHVFLTRPAPILGPVECRKVSAGRQEYCPPGSFQWSKLCDPTAWFEEEDCREDWSLNPWVTHHFPYKMGCWITFALWSVSAPSKSVQKS